MFFNFYLKLSWHNLGPRLILLKNLFSVNSHYLCFLHNLQKSFVSIQFLSQGVPLFLSVTELKEQSNLIVTFHFNFVPQCP